MTLVPLPRVTRPRRMFTLLILTAAVGILSIMVATLTAMVLLTTDDWALSRHGTPLWAQLAISAGGAVVFTVAAGLCWQGNEGARVALIPLAATNTVCHLILIAWPIRMFTLGTAYPIPGISDDIAFGLGLVGGLLSAMVVWLLTRPKVKAWCRAESRAQSSSRRGRPGPDER